MFLIVCMAFVCHTLKMFVVLYLSFLLSSGAESHFVVASIELLHVTTLSFI